MKTIPSKEKTSDTPRHLKSWKLNCSKPSKSVTMPQSGAHQKNAATLLSMAQDYYNMKGVFSDRGQRKKSSYVLEEWYKGK